MIFGPIVQVGWASASSGVTSRELVARAAAERPAARGQDEVTAPARRARAHWKSAECSLSTGISSPSARAARRERELAGGDEALLVRERERDPVLERPHRRREPGEADDRVQDDVGLRRARAARSGRRRSASSGARPSIGVEPDVAATSSSSGLRVDHLDRLAADRAGRAEQGDPLHRHSVPGGYAAGAMDATIVARRARRTAARRGGRACRRGRRAAGRVLDAAVALQHRLEQVAERRRDRDTRAEDERLADRR